MSYVSGHEKCTIYHHNDGTLFIGALSTAYEKVLLEHAQTMIKSALKLGLLTGQMTEYGALDVCLRHAVVSRRRKAFGRDILQFYLLGINAKSEVTVNEVQSKIVQREIRSSGFVLGNIIEQLREKEPS